MAKRQEIYDQVLSHFNDLKQTLKQIQKAEYGVRIADLRSTVIVVKTFCWCLFAIIVLSFAIDVYTGLYSTTGRVMGDMINEAVNFAFDLLGF